MYIPVYLPRFIAPSVCECDCMREKIDMEFKAAQITWLKKEGDFLKKGEVICEAEIEKAICEIMAPSDAGLHEICIPNGAFCGVKDVLCYIEEIR